ncbi:MAG: hypothetical protein HYZ27_05670, partial [Deltaproteobacteria bacterium]|nr:hypothetical protein [Deltaproteobacteria bacterium]
RTASDLEDDDNNPALICTHVTGTVTAADDSTSVDFVLATRALSPTEQQKCEAL